MINYLKKYPFLNNRNAIKEYVVPDYYNKLLKPYVFDKKTDLDIFESYLNKNRSANLVLELCSGSGRASEVAIKVLPNASLILSDLSLRMLNYTKQNLKMEHKIRFMEGDAVNMLREVSGKFDLVYTLWGFSHSVHQHIHEIGFDKTKILLEKNLQHFIKNNLKKNGKIYLVHFDSMSDEQRILMRQWQRVYKTFSDISRQSPSKMVIDEVLSDLDNRNKIILSEKHLIGDPIKYENKEELLEIFLNFHLETFFNNSEILPIVIEDINKNIKQYRNDDGSYSIRTGCYIYEVEKR